MGLWEFLQQWRGGRAAAGIAASVLLHLLVVAVIFWGGKLPLTEKWRAKPGDALIVELPKSDESPAPGSPDAPPAASSPSPPPAAPAPRPQAAPAPPAAKPQPPAPARVASAPRAAEPTPAKPAPHPADSPRAAPAEPAPDARADRGPADPTAGASAPKVERVPPGPPSNQQTASVPPGGAPGAPGQNTPDMRSLLRRGAGGRGEGWAGIEGEPIRLDAIDPDYSAFLQQVKRQIYAKWGYPCIKNPSTHGCDYYNARLYVVFGIQKSGRLQVVEMQTSSGYDIYDEYALNAIRLAAPYPPVPPAMLAKFKPTNIGVPIVVQFTYSVETSLGTILR